MIHPRSLACLGALAFGVAPARADAPSVEERLQRIEAALARLEARLNDSVSADELAPTLKEYSDLTHQLGWDGKSSLTLAKAGGKEQKLSVGGYLQLNGEAGDAPDSRFTGINDRFLVRRARLTVKGAFAENIDFTLQSEFGNSNLAANTGYRAQLTDVFVNWNKYEVANVQLGQFKTPFGYEQLLPDTKVASVERSLPTDSLTLGRQIGLALNGAIANKHVTYSAGLFNGNGVNNGNNDNDQFLYAARVAAVPWTTKAGRASVGVNALRSRDNGTSFSGHRTGWGVDGQFNHGALDLAGEYLHQHLDRFSGADTSADGWYAQASWYFPGRVWQALARYESYNANTAAAGNTSDTWILGLTYYLKGDDLKLSLNYLLGDPAGPLKNQDRLLGRFQVIF
jgi:phosphate-selective porin OprO/OprP